MLRRLTIEDYGLIPRAEVDFAAGSTMFTGETGSGKTMVLGALAFVLGERASPDAVRRGRARAMVTLLFDVDAAMRERLSGDGFDLDPDEDATISRELSAESGKSTIRLNGRPSTAGYIRELASQIVDMAGQHEAQRLLSPAYHVELLDRFAGEDALYAKKSVASLHRRCGEMADALREFDRDERRVQEQLAFARYAVDEIRTARPEAGEDDRLLQRRSVLENAEHIAVALRGAHEALAGENASATDALGQAAGFLQHIGRMGQSFEEMSRAAQALQGDVHELAVRASRELEGIESDPGELDAVHARLETLDTLKRKYGPTLADVERSVQEFESTIEAFENKDERKATLEAEFKQAHLQLEQAAEHLSSLRHAAAERLCKAVERQFKDVALSSARFGVRFEPLSAIAPSGSEGVHFTFAANKGEAERPLARVASGGELSRVLLALSVVLAASRGGTALVFDEIDAGVGGAAATAVGARLGRLAQHAQIVCVTHLAQIASWADTHYVLEKLENRNATTIVVRAIPQTEERTTELARMLSGEAHDVALQHARTLLAQTKERRLAV